MREKQYELNSDGINLIKEKCDEIITSLISQDCNDCAELLKEYRETDWLLCAMNIKSNNSSNKMRSNENREK